MLKPYPFSPPLLSYAASTSNAESAKSTPTWHLEQKKLKYPRITIKPDLAIIVRVPLHFKQRDIEHFVGYHSQWIASALAKLSTKAQNLHSMLDSHKDEILLFGQWCEIAALRQKLEDLLDSSAIESSKKPGNQNPKHLQSLKHLLKSVLLGLIEPRAEHWSRQMGLAYQSLKITNALSRFGSCTYDNHLRFSLMLALADRRLIDYVIIHELAHIAHKNHSKHFWNLVETHCPNAKALRAELRAQGGIYPALLKRLESCC